MNTRASRPTETSAAVPKGFVAIPKRLTHAMQAVMAEEGWQWADFLAAAEVVSEREYENLLRADSLDAFEAEDTAASGEPQATTQGNYPVESLLRAMARNYTARHSWDHLDVDACVRAANEIERLRVALGAWESAAPTPEQIESVFNRWAGSNDWNTAYLCCYIDAFRTIASELLALAQPAQAGKPQDRADTEENAARYVFLREQHEIDDEQASSLNYGKTYPPRTLVVFHGDGEDGLEPIPCDPGELDKVIDDARKATGGTVSKTPKA